ncbi:IS3 family transposase, partial [Legionella nagasakiensis]
LIHWRNYQTRREAKQDILDYMTMFYNNQRLHSFLDYQSPNQFENRFWGLMKNVA